eukprot:CAMPEP_0168385420 /NCGR_PEP_ID=MMETSP0228-20121227/14911_1 /TAXON_ID=133427 /ORGANISM="Protoceratium reticulatum, Strain CCCM 535 (=CCMP 1889)" /LENGTH=1206 /DNA_ID=CAMNT_0008398605 /DNA_START=31 /DNA_END=3649 /DNA_ORIENTATION=-
MTLAEFMDAGFLDKSFGSLALHLLVYNANMQSMTEVKIHFDADSAGYIDEKDVKPLTLMLDIHDPIMRYFELAYLIFTSCYFIEFCYRAYKFFPDFLKEFWSYINFVSIVSSLLSLTLWYTYMPAMDEFVQTADWQNVFILERHFQHKKMYLRSAAFAVLTICLRILQFLGNTNSRVKLLLRTLGMGAYNIGIYVSYIVVVFWGFAVFAFTRFSIFSRDFVTIGSTLHSCLKLFLGDTSSFDKVKDSFKVPFFILFMLVFYFVSVQMFNAIINYAYNRVSEEMEPELEQEKRERNRKRVRNLGRSEAMWGRFVRCFQHLTGKHVEREKAAAKDPEAEKKRATFDAVDVKGKVESYRNRHKNRQAPDGICSILLFFIFAVLYVVFLQNNLSVSENARVKKAIDKAVAQSEVEFQSVGGTKYIRFDTIYSLDHVVQWITGALPQVVFRAAIGAQSPDAVCIKTWNCLITGAGYDPAAAGADPTATAPTGTVTNNTNGSNASNVSNATNASAVAAVLAPNASGQEAGNASGTTIPNTPRNVTLIRITQRQSQLMVNEGRVSTDTPADQRFTGGIDNVTKQINSFLLSERRLGREPLWPDAAPGNEENRSINLNLELDGRPFCRSSTSGGYAGRGGAVCLLDADYGTFLSQVRAMLDGGFFSAATSTIVIDFVAYNGNQNMLTYVEVKFVTLPSGRIDKQIKTSSIRLFDLAHLLDNWRLTTQRLLPGVVYLVLVGKFAWNLYWALRQEIFRKRLNASSSWISTTFEFITQDIFNSLEAISILISWVSAVLFLMWLIEEGRLDAKLQNGKLGEILDFAGALNDRASLYNQLSAINVLLIFIRPLKFIRSNAIMAKLYNTLWEARTDLSWFVVMFVIAMFGYVLFAFVTFGPNFFECRSIVETFHLCFGYILGNFNLTPIVRADPLMAPVFIVPYLLGFYLIFLNIFFAIIDRHFVLVDPPPFNLKRRLKPIFQRICRCFEWDEDYVMEQEHDKDKGPGPPSRQSKVKKTQAAIQKAISAAAENAHTLGPKTSKLLSDVCDPDERMAEVLLWGREEANLLITDFQRLLSKKQSMKNDEAFIKQDVMKHIKELSGDMKDQMEEAERHMRYATKVHEQMSMRDQETLSKYILLLEHKIQNKMILKHALQSEVYHLLSESDQMRFTSDELKQLRQPDVAAGRQSERWSGEEGDWDPGPDPQGAGPAALADLAGS